MTEEWRWVDGYEGVYEISNQGRLRKYKRSGESKIVKTFICAGYECVGLIYKGKKRHTRIHNLVAEAFISPKKNGFQVHHIDGNKSNNVLSNIAYISSKDHHRITADETRIGLRLGEWTRNNQSKRVVAMTDDYNLLVIFNSASEAGKCLGTDPSIISKTARDFWSDNPIRKHTHGFKWVYFDNEEVEKLCCRSNVWQKVQPEIVGCLPIMVNTLFWTPELRSKLLKRELTITC